MENTEKSIYEILGGEPVVRELVERFYYHMDTLPEVALIRKMHPENMASSVDKLFCFLSGWLGGPQLFVEKYGHPMLRRRHFPFSIGKTERDQWMNCMLLAVEDIGIEEPLKTELLEAFLRLADHMRNRQEPAVSES